MADDVKPGAGEKALKDLELLSGAPPEGRKITVNGKEIVVIAKQVKTGKIPKLVKAAGSLMQMLVDKRTTLEPAKLIMYFPEECLNVISVLADLPRETVDEMEIDDTVLVLTDCIEANVDFFVRRILPLLRGRVQGMAQALLDKQTALAGLEPLSTSSETAT